MNTPLSKRDDEWSVPVRIAAGYTVFAILWIIAWDLLGSRAPIDDDVLLTIRRIAYIAGSAAFLAWLVHTYVRRMHLLRAQIEAFADQDVVGFFLSRDNHLVAVNDRLVDMMGSSRAELLSRPATDFLDPTELERARVHGWGGGEGEVYRRFMARRADGTTIPAHVIRRPVELASGTGFAGIVLDASRAEALEGRLRQSAKLEVLGQVTGSVTGDFDTLVTSMIGQLDRALVTVPPAQPVYGSLAVVRDTARRAAALTSQLLTFARAEPSASQMLDVTATVRGLSGLFGTVAGANVRVRYELDDHLPPVSLDLSSFDRIAVSLVVNAKQAAGEGGQVTVRTRSIQRDGATRIAVEVEDSGPLPSPDAVDAVAFVTARTIVEEAGGVFEVEAAERRGTRVRVLLPSRIAGPTIPLPDPSHNAPVARPGWRAGHTVMVVDDEAPVRRVTTAALRRQGYHVVEAADADSALTLLRANDRPIDLAICDFMLDGTTGVQLYRRMAEERPDLKVIFITGFTARDLAEKDPSLTAFTFIEKPFSVEHLTASVDALWEIAS